VFLLDCFAIHEQFLAALGKKRTSQSKSNISSSVAFRRSHAWFNTLSFVSYPKAPGHGDESY
jgi:hypothetical protein